MKPYYRKYGNYKPKIDGITFDSKLEGDVYCRLRLFSRTGLISNLKVHEKFVLQDPFEINGRKVRAITYEADFTYVDNKGRYWVIDAKGFRTDVYKLKKKLFEHKFGKEITEISKYQQIDACI